MSYLFWLSAVVIMYAYFGYPLCLFALSLFKSKNKAVNHELSAASYEPIVSFIITAYNEEKRIREKIKNSLKQDYPKDKLEIIIASDCSTDRTDEIANSYESQDLRLVRSPERRGKEHAQELAVGQARGDILVFSDVSTIIEPDGLRTIVANFADPSVGCASSVDKFINPDGSVSGEGAYVRYEMFLRNLESRVNTLVGLSGSFFAARKEVCMNWAPDLQSDFNTLLNSVKMGLRGISDPKTVGYYKNIADEKKEFNRKVRTVLRGISVLMRNLSFLNPFQYGLFSWQLFSHKLCRWLVPLFLILSFISNAVLAFSSPFYLSLLILQLIFYAMALIYHRAQRNQPSTVSDELACTSDPTDPKDPMDPMDPIGPTDRVDPTNPISYQLLKLPYYFVAVNAGILLAWWKYLKGDRALFWEPSER